MDIAILSLAFAAGVSTFFSPCGVALLPSYVAYLLAQGEKEEERKTTQILKGLKIGIIVSLGIITVFMGLGLLVSLIGNVLAPYAFWFGAITGILLIILGIAMLKGKSLSLPGLHLKAERSLSFKGYFLFGVVYAVGGIACTLGVFLFVVFSSLAAGSFRGAILNFISFSAGSALFMIGVTTATATAKSLVSEWINKYIKIISRASALIIIIGGIYLIWFNAKAFI